MKSNCAPSPIALSRSKQSPPLSDFSRPRHRVRRVLSSLALALVATLANSTIIPSVDGAVEVHSSNRYFQNDSGEPQFLLGFYAWAAMIDGQFIDNLGDYRDMMDAAASNNLNYIRISCGINYFDGNTSPPSSSGQPKAIPFKMENGKANLDQWDESWWSGLTDQVEYARTKGLIIHVAIFDGVDIRGGSQQYRWVGSYWNIDNQTRSFFGDLDANNNGNADTNGEFYQLSAFNNDTGVGKYQRDFIDKVIATVGGYDHVFLEVGNETFGANNSWYAAINAYIRERTALPITINGSSATNRSAAMSDGAAQHRANTPAEVKTKVGEIIGQGFPAWEDPDGPDLARGSDDDLRRSAWYSLTGGAAGWGGFHYAIWDGAAAFDKDVIRYYQYLQNFLDVSGVRFWQMLPDHDLVSAPSENSCLAKPGNEYLVYVLNDSNATVDLSALSGTAHYKLYNPKTDTFSAQATVEGGAVQTFTRPSGADDWVIHISAAAGEAPAQLSLDMSQTNN